MSKMNALAMEKQIADEERLEITRERLGRLTEIHHHLVALHDDDKYNFDSNTRLILNLMKKQIDSLCKVDEQTVDLLEMELTDLSPL